jgi:uncharacterized protein YkwD
MNRLRSSLPFCLLPLAALVPAAPLPAQEPAPSLETPILTWTNQYRLHYGRPAVQVNPVLSQIARQHAYQMAAREEMAHNLNGKTVIDRSRAAGYAYQKIGENVAFNAGYQNPAWKCFTDWMYSPSHWENIQEPAFTEIGIGVCRSASGKYYACQVLAQPVVSMPRSLYLARQPNPLLAPLPEPYFTPFANSPPIIPPRLVPDIELPQPRQGGRSVEFSPVFQMPAQDYYVHPFSFGFGN